jgi:hypothetical protein
LNKISVSGQYSLILKFFPNTTTGQRLVSCFKLISSESREDFIKHILKKTVTNYLYLKNCVNKVIFEILFKRKHFLNELSLKMKDILMENEMFYYNDIYDIFVETNIQENFKFKKIIFFFSKNGLIEKIFKILFYNITKIRYSDCDMEEIYYEYIISLRNHIKVLKKKKRVESKRKSKIDTLVKHEIPTNELRLKKMYEKIRIYSEDYEISNKVDADYFNQERKFVKFEENFFNIRRSYTNKNLLKKKLGFSSTSFDSITITKPVYNKIDFYVNIPKYLGKERKILEFSNLGCFTIYKKGKVKYFLFNLIKNENITTFMLQDIIQLEGGTSNNILNLTHKVNDIRKVKIIEFNNPYEKYVFKTIYYNYSVIKIKLIF